MDIDLYSQSIQYEQLTQAIYQAILQREGMSNIEVEHDVTLRGRSGVEHQIDVLWRFRQAGVEHKVVIECKNYATSLTLEKVRNFFAVAHDVGNVTALMVTKTGYQSGAVDFANHYGIGLKLLRKPTEDDWKGKVKDIHVNITAKTIASSADKPIVAELYLRPKDEKQESRVEQLQENGRFEVVADAQFRFVDIHGIPTGEEMAWFLPRHLDTTNKQDGGPYTQKIPLENKYAFVNEGDPDQELMEVIGIVATYYVESFSDEVISHGEDIVEAILKDFNSEETEYVHPKA